MVRVRISVRVRVRRISEKSGGSPMVRVSVSVRDSVDDMVRVSQLTSLLRP
jgi:hypothetical protein